MYRGKYIFLFIFLISIVSKSEYIDEKISKDIKKIDEIEKQIKYDKVEDASKSVHIGNGEKANLTFNKDISNPSSYIVYSNGNPDSVKVVNNANLSSGAEVITSLHNHDFANLIHITNNKNIIGTANNVSPLSLIGKYVYFKNSKDAVVKTKYDESLYFSAYELGVLDNAGKFEKKAELNFEKGGSVINRDSGILSDMKVSSRSYVNYINDGEIKGELDISSSGVTRFVNSGTVNKISDISSDYYRYEEKLFINKEKGIIKGEYLKTHAGNMNFKNFGNIESSNIEIGALKGSIENNGKIIGNVTIDDSNISDKTKRNSYLNVNLQNGRLEGNLILKRKDLNETIVTIKSMDNVTGNLISDGDNDTLRLLGSGKVTSVDKFKDFEKIHLQKSDWTFIGSNSSKYKVNKEILVEDSIATFEKAFIRSGEIINKNSIINLKSSNLIFKKIFNDETSTINILESSNFMGLEKFLNKGRISFLENRSNYNTLDITGDYVGEKNANILMKTYIDGDNSKSDKILVNGRVYGHTSIEISNPNSTLEKRLKKRLKLVESKDSTKDAFSLLNPEHGIYKYKLSLDDNDWYLEQEYNKDVIGIIANSYYKVRNEFNLKYNDHNRTKNINAKRLWTKISNTSSKNILSDNKNFNIFVDSNFTTVMLGSDLGITYAKDNMYKYGIFGNIGFDKVISSNEKKLGNTDIFGIGSYGTWKNKNWYAEAWLNYMYSQNIVNVKDRVNYGLHTFKSSIEVGTGGDMYLGKNRLHANLYCQLIYSYIKNLDMEKFDDIRYTNNSNLKSKLGTDLTLFTKIKNINPYLEFNWNYDVKLSSIFVDNEKYYYNGNKNTFELKWGLKDINIDNNLSIWANAIHRFNEIGYGSNGGEIGLLYKII